MERKQEVKDFIGVYDGWLDETLCKHALKLFEADDKLRNVYDRNAYQKIDTKSISDSAFLADGTNIDLWADELEPILCNLQMAWEHYNNECKLMDLNGVKEVTFTKLKVQRTKPGQGFHVWHTERNYQAKHWSRVAVFTVYLNEGFEGGETEFLIQNKRVAPKTGRICFFPAGFPWVHRGNPPINGEKFILTSWLIVPDEQTG